MDTTISPDLLMQFEAFVAGDERVERHALFERCRSEAPLFRSPTLDAWVVTRYEDVLAVMKDEDRFNTLREGPGAPPYGNSVLQWRGREHQTKGGVIGRHLRTPASVREIDTYVEELATRLVSEMPFDGISVDLKEGYSMWLPLLVTARIMGIPDPVPLRQWYEDIAAGSVNSIGHPERRQRAFEALEELGDYLRPLIEQRRETPGEDLLSELCSVTYEDEPLPFEQIRATAAFLLTAGVETTERALASLLKHLFADPDHWRRLQDEPELITSVVAESLRVYPPIYASTRIAIADTEYRGVDLLEGERLLVLHSSANRDSEVFEDPHEFRMDRWMPDPERQFTPAGSILPFGAGRHYCMGSQLARVEMVRGVQALLDKVDRAEFAGGVVPPDEGFLLRSPATVEVVLTPR